MVVIAFGQKIADAAVDRPRLGSVNLHASLLPKYRGAAPINWAILSGETVTGNSVIRLAQRMDAGAVLAQSRAVDRRAGDGRRAARPARRRTGRRWCRACWKRLADGRATGGRAGRIAGDAGAEAVRATSRSWTGLGRPSSWPGRVRGLYPWPGCRVELCDAGGDGVGPAAARPGAAAGRRRRAPLGGSGEIMTDGLSRPGAGALEIVECQPEGKRPMPLADYRRGHRWHAGSAPHFDRLILPLNPPPPPGRSF